MYMPPAPQGSQAAPVSVSGLCPLCKQRPADTTVYYDEVLSSRVTAARSGRRRVAYSSSALSSHGKKRLCAECARQYEDSVASRKLGRRLINWGVGLLFAGAVLFLILLYNTRGTLFELVLALPVLVGIVIVGSAAGLLFAGNRQKQPLVGYLREQVKQQVTQ